ncbi:MAG: hypothetical protein KatS3mg059_1010 [Thermomicrobiales bacterium]|nr:MAG: hypothetical protein KatS3mg059_1010 [Thermomicrobiales bacterium]
MDLQGPEDPSGIANLFEPAVIEAPSPAPRAAALLRDQAARIMANWSLRVANLPAFRAMPDLSLRQLQATIPAILDAALATIATSDPSVDPGALQRALDLAAEHGKNRANEGFAVGDVLAEFQELRVEVWSALWRVIEDDVHLLNALRALQERLSHTFDSLMIAAAESWVATRLG